jgi:putative transcriptional regulator
VLESLDPVTDAEARRFTTIVKLVSWGAWFLVVALVILLPALFFFAGKARADDTAIMLVASADLDQPQWQRTVVVVTRMPSGGHLGLIVNRPTKMTMAKLFPDFAPARNVREPIYFGGPHHTDMVAMVAKREPNGPHQIRLMPGATLTFRADTIDEQLTRAPNEARYFVGVVVWMPGEMESEVDRGFWLQAPAPSNALFVRDTSRMWEDMHRAARGTKVEAPTFAPLLGIRG